MLAAAIGHNKRGQLAEPPSIHTVLGWHQRRASQYILVGEHPHWVNERGNLILSHAVKVRPCQQRPSCGSGPSSLVVPPLNSGLTWPSLAAIRTCVTQLVVAGSGCKDLLPVPVEVFAGGGLGARRKQKHIAQWRAPVVLPGQRVVLGSVGQ